VLRIIDLERQHQVLETSYLANVVKMEQAATLQALENADISSVSELQRASFVSRPIGMGRSKKLLLGILLGIVSGLALAFIAEYFDRTFVSASHVENSLEVPVLVSIPQGRRQFSEVN
jgi:capsular polysaccharide biosynthesis protein